MTVSRRASLSTGTPLLAGFTADAVPAPTWAAVGTAASGTDSAGASESAVHRSATVSAADYAPIPAHFAVDRLSLVGMQGTGRRTAQGDPQWITIDLHAQCEIEAVTLSFEAALPGAATSFTLDVSTDDKTWQTIYQTTSAPGGQVEIPLGEPMRARYLRMTSTACSHANPVGLNGFQIFGTGDSERPSATGWTSWSPLPQPAPPLEIAADGTVPVESGWSITLGDFDDADIPEALSGHGWWYRRPFSLPRGLDTAAGRHVWLEFDGVNRQAVVQVDGTDVGALTHPSARAAFDITSALKPGSGEHVLAVETSPLPAVRDRATDIWDHVRLRSTGDAVLGDPHVITALPKLPDTSVAEITIEIPVSNAGTVTQTITVYAAFDNVALSGRVSVAAGQSATVTFAPADHPQLTVHQPRLWWPNGYGEPALHDLAFTASVAGVVSDRRAYRFGIREFGYSYGEPAVVSPPAVPMLGSTDDQVTQTKSFPVQNARYLRVQCGTRAIRRGDSMRSLSVFDTAGPSPITDLALDQTVTASPVYEDDQWIQVDLGSTQTFDQVTVAWEQAYAANYMIQVSHDRSMWADVLAVDNSASQLTISCNGVQIFCRGGSWDGDEPLRRVLPDRLAQTVAMHRDMNFTMIRNRIGGGNREELYAACDENGILVWNDLGDGGDLPQGRADCVAMATDAIRRHRIHPCIAVWCGADEALQSPDLGADLASVIAAENPEIFYQADSAGVPVSGHGPYSWMNPAQYYDIGAYDTDDFGFHTEIGIPVASVLESMQHLLGDETPWPSSEAQFVDYESMRGTFEAWTAKLWQNTSDTAAVPLWMSHPAWHSTVWQTYDYDLDVNGAYFGARKGCEPLHIQADPIDWRTLAANHTPHAITDATITASVYDLNGRQWSHSEQQGVNIAAASTTPGLTVAWPPSLPDLNLVRLELADVHGKVLSRNTYWRYAAATDMQAALSSLAETRLTLKLSGRGARELTATVTNNGTVVAAMVRLSLHDQTGERILPTQYSDNYLWLLPGESDEVVISRPDGSAFGREPQVIVQAYNSAAVIAY
jgi:hypothetical protein